MFDQNVHQDPWFFFIIVAFLLPWLSAVASYSADRQLLLTLFLLLGSTVILVTSRWGSSVGDRFFLILIGSVSLALLFSSVLYSNYLVGYDIHEESYVLSQVLRGANWQTETGLLYNSVLSVSILPAMISVESGLDGVLVLKFLFPILFAMVPVVLYKIYRKILRPDAAFLSVFLFVSYPAFYDELTQVGRQEIAELLLVLLLWLMLSVKTINGSSKMIAIVLLTVGLITAHYALAYIYVLALAFSYVASRVSRRTVALCSLGTVLLSFGIALSWYLFAAGGIALFSLAQFSSFVVSGLVQDLFNPASRPGIVLQAFGLESVTPGILHDANRVTQYLVQFSLVLGFLVFVLKRRKTVAETQMLPLMTIAVTLLGSAVVLPFFALGLNLSRFYHIALLFISPCFVYGVELLERALQAAFRAVRQGGLSRAAILLSRRRVLAAGILFSYFLFTSGWVWAVSLDRPTSLTLDRERMLTYPDLNLKVSYFSEVTLAQDVAAAGWLRSHIPVGRSVCADYVSRFHVLNSYGELPRQGPILPTGCDFQNDYIYLSVFNVRYGLGTDVIYERGIITWPLSDISTKLTTENRIYSGNATIYLNPSS